MQVDALKGVKLKYSRSFEMHYKSSLLGGSYSFYLYNEYSNEESVDREKNIEKYMLIKWWNCKRLSHKKDELKVVENLWKYTVKVSIVKCVPALSVARMNAAMRKV